MSDFVKYCKIDTKKQGNSIVDQKQYRMGYDKLFNVDDPTNLFDGEGLLKLKEESYIGRKTDNALNIPKATKTESTLSTRSTTNSSKNEAIQTPTFLDLKNPKSASPQTLPV